MPTRARLTTRVKAALAHLSWTTVARDIPLSSAAKLRAPPRLPHSTFPSSDVTRRNPPARAASRSTEDRESRSALLAPAVDREGHPTPQSRPERPRSREQEPRLTSNVGPLHWIVIKNSWCGVACIEEIRNQSIPLKLEAPLSPVCGFFLGLVGVFVESPHRALWGRPNSRVRHYYLRCGHYLRMHLARRAIGSPWPLTPGTRPGGPGRCPPVSGPSVIKCLGS